MSLVDKERWNKKYTNTLLPQNIIEVVDNYANEAKGNKALDIACGMGRNSKLLASKGFEVHALDISEVAIETLRNEKNIEAKIVDFDAYTLEENSYDLIVCTYFLERKLFPQIENALKEDGIFIFETFMHDEANTKVPSNKAFLLNKGELKEIFSKGYDIIHLAEFMCGDFCMKSSLVARKKK